MSKIHKTTDYSQFKHFKSNRPVNEKLLIESIQENDMLASHPIVVTKNMYVIDGQHRLAAAKHLGLPIYYLIDETIKETDIPRCQVHRAWTLDNFRHFYKDHNEDYKFIYDTVEKYNLSLSFILRICSPTKYPEKAFRLGRFFIRKDKEAIIENIEKLIICMEICKSIVGFHGKISKEGIQALYKLVTIEGFNIDIFKHKAERYRDALLDSFQFNSVSRTFEGLLNIYEKYQKKRCLERE